MAERDPKNFCDSMQSELTGLKARAFDIVRQIEKMPEKERFSSEFTEVVALVDDLNVTIDHLKSACPTDWSSEKREIEKKRNELMSKINWWDEEHIPGGYVGG